MQNEKKTYGEEELDLVLNLSSLSLINFSSFASLVRPLATRPPRQLEKCCNFDARKFSAPSVSKEGLNKTMAI